MLQLDDLAFEVESATLEAFVYPERGGIAWGLEVRTRPRVVEDAGPWDPFAYCEVLHITPPHTLQSWTQLAGTAVAWAEANVPGTRDVRGVLYIYEHSPIYDSALSLEEGATPNTLHLAWRGRVDPHWKAGPEPQYYENVAMSIAAEVTFAGFLCGHDDERTARARVGAMIDVSAFRFTREHGASHLVP